MKNYIFTLLLVLSSVFVFGQDTDAEQKEKEEFNTIRIEIERSPKKALVLIENYENKVQTQKGKAFTQLLYGLYYYFTNSTSRVDSCYIKASSIFESIGDKKGMITAKSNLAVMQQIRGDFKLALETYKTNLPYLIEIKDTHNIANTHNNIASIFMMTKDIDKASYHYEKALKKYIEFGDENGHGLVLSKLGKIEFDSYRFDTANDYYLRALDVFIKSKDSLGIGNTTIKLGDILFEKDGNIQGALIEYKKAYKLLISIGTECSAVFADQAIGDSYFELKDYKNAKLHYEQTIEKAKLCEYNYALPSMYENLIKTEEKLGNYKQAFLLQKQQIVFKDSIYALEKIEAINDIETKYQTAEKEKALLQNEVELLSKTQEIDKQNKQFWIVASGLGAIFAILLMGIYFYKKQQALNTKLSELNNFKSQIFTIIGHDLRSPIASIAMSAENDSTKQKTSTALGILDDLLLWGSANQQNLSTQKEAIYFETILDELTDEYANEIQEKDLRFTQNFENCKPIYADKNEMTTILRNLITNAIKYNTPKGTIHVSCKAGELLIENTFLSTIASGTQIGLDIVQKLSENNNCTFEFTKDKLALAKLKFND